MRDAANSQALSLFRELDRGRPELEERSGLEVLVAQRAPHATVYRHRTAVAQHKRGPFLDLALLYPATALEASLGTSTRPPDMAVLFLTVRGTVIWHVTHTHGCDGPTMTSVWPYHP